MRTPTKMIFALVASSFMLGGCFPGSGGGGGQPVAKSVAGSKPCWVGTWLVTSESETVAGVDGTIHVVGNSGEVLTLQANGVLLADYTKAGALVGTAGAGPIAVQYQGTENAFLTMTGSTSGTFTEKIVTGALFSTVSNGQSNTQRDQPGATQVDHYSCSASALVLTAQGLQENLTRTG